MTPKIAIIIVTYNAMKWADQCFRSIRNSSVPVQVYVIDNGSTDGTQKFIKEKLPEIDLTISDKNLGFGKANNLGIEKAYQDGADFFYLMNQDAWLFADTLEKLLDVYESFPNQSEIGILSPMHLDGSEQKLDLHFENYLAKDTRKNRLLSDVFIGNAKDFYEIQFVNAAHWFLPKHTVEKIGGFNPYFFYGAEDYEYINRVLYFGMKILVCTKSKAVHDAVQSFHKKEPENAAEALFQKRLSMQMQRETRYLDPKYQFQRHREQREFLSNIVKLAAKGNFEESAFYLEQFRYFKTKFSEIENSRKVALHDPHPFLALPKTPNQSNF